MIAIADDVAIGLGLIVIGGAAAVLSTPQGKNAISTVGEILAAPFIAIKDGIRYKSVSKIMEDNLYKVKSEYKKQVKKKKDSKTESKNLKKLDDKYLKEKGIDPHSFKKEYGFKKKGSRYDIYLNKDDGYIWIFPRGAQHGGINTYIKIK